jgi:hypothetical protein
MAPLPLAPAFEARVRASEFDRRLNDLSVRSVVARREPLGLARTHAVFVDIDVDTE